MILHAGDIGSPEILDALASIAPVRAVRGNNDRGAWASAVPELDRIEVDGVRILLLHALQDLHLDPAAEGLHAVVVGHSHKPSIQRRDGVLYVNPGSAGPRRFRLPIGVAILEIHDRRLEARWIDLGSQAV